MARYRPNGAGITAIGRSDGVRRALDRVGYAVRVRAEQIAPVDTGRYRSRFRVQTGVDGRSAWVQVSNDATNPVTGYPYAVAPMEFSTSKARGHRVLGRALGAARGRKATS